MDPRKKILFAGDSITEAGRFSGPSGGLGDGYVSQVAARLALAGDPTDVVNRGVSGNCALDLRKRWQVDVVDESPDVLTIFVGINETSRRFDRDDPTPDDVFERHYRALIDSIDPARLDLLVLVEPFLVPVDEEQKTWLDELAGKRTTVARLADEYGAVFLPLHDALGDRDAADASSPVTWDGIHPTPLGHGVIASSWLACYQSRFGPTGDAPAEVRWAT